MSLWRRWCGRLFQAVGAETATAKCLCFCRRDDKFTVTRRAQSNSLNWYAHVSEVCRTLDTTNVNTCTPSLLSCAWSAAVQVTMVTSGACNVYSWRDMLVITLPVTTDGQQQAEQTATSAWHHRWHQRGWLKLVTHDAFSISDPFPQYFSYVPIENVSLLGVPLFLGPCLAVEWSKRCTDLSRSVDKLGGINGPSTAAFWSSIELPLARRKCNISFGVEHPSNIQLFRLLMIFSSICFSTDN